MNKTWIKTAIACALATTPLHAAEWTRTLDLAGSVPTTTYLSGGLAATDDALWIGPDDAFDPRTGASLSPFEVSERITLVGAYPSAVSSRRGLLWSRFVSSNRYPFLYADGAHNAWGRELERDVLRVSADGAQEHRWTGTDLGYPEHIAISVDPSATSDQAVVVLWNQIRDSAKTVVRLNARGRVLGARLLPACVTGALDDRAGGYYTICGTGSIAGPHLELQRVRGDGSAAWPAPLTFEVGTRFQVLTDGTVLAHAGSQWQYLRGDGSVAFSTNARHAADAGDTFWFWSEQTGQLQHLRRDGSEISRVAVTGVRELAGHRSGSALARTEFNDTGIPQTFFQFFSADGARLRTFAEVEDRGAPPTRIRLNSGLPFADHADGSAHADFLDDHGNPLAPSFPTKAGGWGYGITRAIPHDDIVCVDGADAVLLVLPTVFCFDRATGRDTGVRVFGAKLVDVGNDIVTRSGQALEIHRRDGTRINVIDTRDAIDDDFRAGIGFAVLTRVGATIKLQRFRTDGALMFERELDSALLNARVGLGADGSTVVAGASIVRVAADGVVGPAQDIAQWREDLAVIDIDVNADGVQVLLQSTADEPERRGSVLLLNPQLMPIVSQRLPKAQMQGIRYREEAPPFDAHTLWPARGGAARVVSLSHAGLVVQRFDAANGVRDERRVLALSDNNAMVNTYERRFSVSDSGVVRVLDRDRVLQRDVLRISETPVRPFLAAIQQQALAGSWYSPTSTGQGVVLELMNDATQLFAAWHTFATEGGNSLAKQEWLTVQGDVGSEHGAITLPIYRNSGGRFDLAGRTDATPAGSAELVFTSCDRLEFWYRIGDEVGALPLQRLTPRTLPCDDGTRVVPADDTAAAIDLSGPWYDPTRSGQGLAVSAGGARFNQFFAGWFTYDADAADDADAQHWFTLQGANPSRYGETISASIFRTIGGSRSGEPTRNTHRVGVAQLTVHDCANATLEYVFDDSAVAGPFADRMRAVSLKRLGVCTN